MLLAWLYRVSWDWNKARNGISAETDSYSAFKILDSQCIFQHILLSLSLPLTYIASLCVSVISVSLCVYIYKYVYMYIHIYVCTCNIHVYAYMESLLHDWNTEIT